MPKGYVIFEFDIDDANEYERYLDACKGVLAEFNGAVLVGPRSARQSLEGDWSPQNFFIIEFPTVDLARGWYFSDAYQKAAAIRQGCTRSRALIAEEQ